jgi:hypothetical protein
MLFDSALSGTSRRGYADLSKVVNDWVLAEHLALDTRVVSVARGTPIHRPG